MECVSMFADASIQGLSLTHKPTTTPCRMGVFKGALGEGIGATVNDVFTRYMKKFDFSIKAQTKSLIIDFVASFPAVLAKSYTSEAIRNCWQAGVKYDGSTGTPCIRTMIDTIPGGVTDKEYRTITRAISHACSKKGGGLDTTEKDLSKMGVREDLNFKGKPVPRDATIKEEWRQRAKCLTVESQRGLRATEIRKAVKASKVCVHVSVELLHPSCSRCYIF